MKKIVFLLPFFVFTTVLAQERKIEKKVYNNFKDGKIDLAYSELTDMREKYEKYSFYHYWKAIIFMEKLAELKKIQGSILTYEATDNIAYAKSSLNEATKLLSEDQLDVEKEEFDILFPGCSVVLNANDKKYTNYMNQLKQDFDKKKEYLNELSYNLSLMYLINEYSQPGKTSEAYTKFLKEIKTRVKVNASKNLLLGEIDETTFMNIADIRNNQKLIDLKKENSDKYWVAYLRNNKDREYLSIVPDLEKMINEYYFNTLQTSLLNNKYNYVFLKATKGTLDKDKSVLNSNLQSYATSKYGDVTFSSEFVKERNANYDKLISMVATKMKEFEDRKAAFENATYTENFFENFEIKANGWYESEDQNALTKISNGKFIFENKYDGGYINLAGKRIAAKNEGFSMSIQTTWVSGIDNKSFDMMWGANGFNSYYSFGISSNGSYIYANQMDGNYTTVIPWTNSEYINRNSTNVISVKRNGNNLELYINYFKVNETPYGEFFGDQLGMIVNGKQRIEYDDLKIGISPYVEPVVEIIEDEDQFLEEYVYEDENLENNDIVYQDGYGPGVKDIDGNKYKTVFIGSQEWMAENLRVSKFNDGTPISNITADDKWQFTENPAWCYFENKVANNLIFGKLYNGYVIDHRVGKNVCPNGWHVPLVDEWDLLFEYLNNNKAEGAFEALRATGNKYWKREDGVKSTNSSLFSALPTYGRYNEGYFFSSDNSIIGRDAYWWTSERTQFNWDYLPSGTYYKLSTRNETLSPDLGPVWEGLPIRCVKD